jgi:hypothetical protein
MKNLLEFLMPWGPVFFGVLLFAPMLAAVLDNTSFSAAAGIPALYLALPLGAIWGLIAKQRGQWL